MVIAKKLSDEPVNAKVPRTTTVEARVAIFAHQANIRSSLAIESRLRPGGKVEE